MKCPHCKEEIISDKVYWIHVERCEPLKKVKKNQSNKENKDQQENVDGGELNAGDNGKS